MKKLLTIIAAATISTSAFADSAGKFYLRADAGAALDSKSKVTVARGTSEVTLKNKASASADLGIGYNMSDDSRIELVFLHRFNPEMKGSRNAVVAGVGSSTRSVKSKAKIETLMLRSYFDLYDFGIGRFFIGGGVGVAQVSNKGSWALANSSGTLRSGSFKNKKKNNFAYSVAAGTSFNIKERIKLDLQYNWSDFGHAKGSDVKYRGHSVMAGLRVDL